MSARRTPKVSPVGTLDLHGYNRSQAISRLTSFLESAVKKRRHSDAPVWVHVITGSGSHSADGPVLRDAVRALLEKRRMRFFLNAGRGCFAVDAGSGITLYAAGPATTSKILTRDRAPKRTTPLQRRALAIQAANRKKRQQTALPPSYGPLPREVAQSDAFVAKSRAKSQEDAKLEKKEKHQLQKAIRMSKTRVQEEDEEYRAEFERVMALSQEDYAKELAEQKRQEELLLKQSHDEYDKMQAELQLYADTHEEEMEEILRRSQEEYEESNKDDDDDDDDLQRILELSKQEQLDEDEDEDLRRVLEASKQEDSSRSYQENEDEELRRILEASKEDSTFRSYQDDSLELVDEDEDLRRVLEASKEEKNYRSYHDDDLTDYDEDLRLALELSKQVPPDPDEELIRALRLSQTGHPDDGWRKLIPFQDDGGGDVPVDYVDDLHGDSYKGATRGGDKEIPLEYPGAGIAFVD